MSIGKGLIWGSIMFDQIVEERARDGKVKNVIRTTKNQYGSIFLLFIFP